MNMHGSEAFSYEEIGSASPARRLEPQPSFEVVTGGGIDSRVRAGVSSEFLARVKMVVAATVLFFILGTLRVALTSMTVAQLSANATLREEISDFTTSNDNLRVERSLMASASRIDRIATQNYGMVLPASFDVIVLSDGSEEELADDGAIAEEGEPAEDEAVDEAEEEGVSEDGAEAEAPADDETSDEAEAPAEDASDEIAEAEMAEESASFDATQLAAGL